MIKLQDNVEKRLMSTWSGKKSFLYSGSVDHGVTLYLGTGYAYHLNVSKESFQNILHTFSGRTIPIGTSRTNPPEDSFGKWMLDNIKTAIASYIGPILIAEGYAAKASKVEIEFQNRYS